MRRRIVLLMATGPWVVCAASLFSGLPALVIAP